MITLRKVFTLSSGRQVAYIANYHLDERKLQWSGSACFDGDWEQVSGGVFLDVAQGFEELAVTGSMEEYIKARSADRG